jgi:hypothetical protein
MIDRLKIVFFTALAAALSVSPLLVFAYSLRGVVEFFASGGQP